MLIVERAAVALFFLAGTALADHKHAASEAHAHHHHAHGAIEVDAAATPRLGLNVTRDTMSGWNIHIVTENFRFAPERVNQSHVPGEGHAHIYVDGRKHARVYGPWFHLGSLGAGQHEIRVTLNANTHDDLAVGGKVVAASVVVEE